MPQLGLGLRANISSSSLYDGDAAAYFTRAGVTSPTAKAQINAFVKGLKNLGLWNSSLCWLLKSSQNAGTGTTAYSLGGLGAFDGTLTNGPTWGADGITFDGSNDYISLPNNSFGTGNSATSIWAFFKNNSTATRQSVLSAGNQNSPTNSFILESPDASVGNISGNIAFSQLNGTISGVTTNWQSLLIGNTTLGFFGNNGGAVSQTTLANALNKLGGNNAIGRMDNPVQNYFNGVVGAIIRIDVTPTTQLNSDIYNLYVSTLARNFDLDADAYISRAGVTDPTAQTQINDFVVGVKSLGLWNDMVCWPLRSTQNAGSGTTAYSLGGFGTYNGTLVNSPTWGTDGITFTSGSSQKITVPAFNVSKTDLILATCQAATSGNLRTIEITPASGSFSGIWAGFGGNYFWDCNSSANTLNRQSGGGPVPTSRIFTHGIASASGATFFVNGSSILSNAVSSTGRNVSVFVINENGGNGNISFAMFSQSITGNASLYNLYKTTLGTGLGLP